MACYQKGKSASKLVAQIIRKIANRQLQRQTDERERDKTDDISKNGNTNRPKTQTNATNVIHSNSVIYINYLWEFFLI